MERVGVLVNKLQEQLSQNASVHNMLATAQLLHLELLGEANKANGSDTRKVSLVVPNAINVFAGEIPDTAEKDDLYKPVPKPETEPVPVAEPSQEPEVMPDPEPSSLPKPEPEPIPHFTEQNPWYSVFPSKEEKVGAWSLDPVLEVPTLAHQEKIVYELNDVMANENASASINEKLKHNNAEVSSLLHDSPVRDLKKAITINDRHRFIHELFRDDETMYERSIKTINSFNIFAEAEYWIQRELKVKLGWDTTLDLVKTFDQLVRRRFS